MYLIITKQHRLTNEVVVYEGDWTPGNYGNGPPHEAVRSFHQFSEGYEPHGWIAHPDSCTEQEFDRRYASGQRVFWLENESWRMTVHVEDPPSTRSRLPTVFLTKTEHAALLKDRELLGDLTDQVADFIGHIYDESELTALSNAYTAYQEHRDAARLDAEVTAVLDAQERRVDPPAPEG